MAKKKKSKKPAKQYFDASGNPWQKYDAQGHRQHKYDAQGNRILNAGQKVYNSIFGTPASVKQIPNYTPQQTTELNQLLQGGINQLQNPNTLESDYLRQSGLQQLQNIQYPQGQQLLNSGLQQFQNPQHPAAQQLLEHGLNQFQNPQHPAAQQLLEHGLNQYQNPTAGFEPIEQRALNRFQTETVPSLAHRFTAFGRDTRLGSSPFQEGLGAAAGGLESELAALKAQYGQQQQQNAFPAIQAGLQYPFQSRQNAFPAIQAGLQYPFQSQQNALSTIQAGLQYPYQAQQPGLQQLQMGLGARENERSNALNQLQLGLGQRFQYANQPGQQGFFGGIQERGKQALELAAHAAAAYATGGASIPASAAMYSRTGTQVNPQTGNFYSGISWNK